MADDVFTQNYANYNTLETKSIAIAVCIEGLETKLSNKILFTRIKYGDAGLTYGGGSKYGDPALVPLDDQQDILSLSGSTFTITQKIEPEQAKGSASSMTLGFIDKNGFMTKLLSPGVLVDEILGKKVKVLLGYQQISFPQDFFTIFRGVITGVDDRAGLAILKLNDYNVRRKNQQVFFSANSTLTAAISDTDTTIPVIAAGDFHQQIIGPDGTVDYPSPLSTGTGVRTFLKIDDEYIEYFEGKVVGNSFTDCVRGVSFGAGKTIVGGESPLNDAAAHDINTDVDALVQITDQSLTMALKIMMSGYNGPFLTDVAIKSINEFATLPVPTATVPPNTISFPDGIDVKEEYGLAIGDYITVSGSFPGFGFNNKTVRIIQIISPDDIRKNEVVEVDDTMLTDLSTSAVVALRSQFDTYPTTCGLKMSPDEVDVEGHLETQDTFLESEEDIYRFVLTDQENGKNFIESELYLPVSAYSLTRFGRCSVKITKPPLADARIQILNQDNILNAAQIRPYRAVNQRKFFNQIVFKYDEDIEGDYISTLKYIDSNSISIIKLTNTLTITSRGSKSEFFTDATALFDRRSKFLLSRYSFGAIQIPVVVNWEIANQIEAGDVVALDGTGLQIANFGSGNRVFGTQLFEVVERKLDFKMGRAGLMLIAGVGNNISDRFATISPSSLTDTGSTTTAIRIKDSFSEVCPEFPGQEYRKWTDYEGLPIRVHSPDYTFDETVTLFQVEPSAAARLIVSPALSLAVPADYVVDIVPYSTSTLTQDNSLYKIVHAHSNPTVAVVTGIDNLSFTVSASDALLFFEGAFVQVHDSDYTRDSPEVRVVSVVSTTITVTLDLGFTPALGDYVELIGYADKGGAYRII